MTRIWRVLWSLCVGMGVSLAQAACVKIARWSEDGV